jgi:hypothetical protein
MTRVGPATLFAALVLASTARDATGHDGPPYPIVSDRAAGPYILSLWTDPDTTDDGSAGGQFWVMVKTRQGADVPSSTRAQVIVAPLDRAGAEQTAAAEPVRGEAATQFARLVLNHEGRFRVRAAVDGPLGPAGVDAEVAATYDLRPPPAMIVVYLLPFALAGLLWARLLLRRRQAYAAAARDSRDSA